MNGSGIDRCPPFDRELAEPLGAILSTLETPLTPLLVADRRRRTAEGRLSDDDIRRNGAFDVVELAVPGADDLPELPLLVCRPQRSTGPHPILFNTHGGGMIAGSTRTDELADELDRAEELQMAVVSVEYRLAPEHPHPAPVEDAYRALTWVAEHAVSLGMDPDRIIVSGNSAGGCLAAALALIARDRHGPRLLGQMLQCPMLDDRCDSVSAAQFAHAGLWDGTSNRAGFDALLGDRRGTDDVSPYAAPGRAADLTGLPPTYLDVGSAEALRDDAVVYASGLWQAGGTAELHVWSGAFHSFDHWVPSAQVSQAAKQARLSWLRRVLAQ